MSIFPLALLAICVSCFTGCKKSETTKTIDEDNVKASKAIILSLTSQELGEKCRVSEESAKTNYLNMIVRVTGKVEKILIEDNGSRYKTCQITLVPDITCDFAITHKDEVQKLTVGQEIIVQGNCGYIGGGQARLRGCTIGN